MKIKTAAVRAARPHMLRAMAFAVLAIGGLVAASTYIDEPDGLIGQLSSFSSSGNDNLAVLGTVVFFIAGIFAIRALARGTTKALEAKMGDARGAPLGLVVSVVGYLLILLPTLQLLGVDLGGLLLGGAITGVVVGIAAQQTLANFFAGMVLLIVRPFTIGQTILLRSGPLGGEYEGRVTDMGLFYVGLETELGPVQLPNAGVLAAAIGPGARQPKEKGDEDKRQHQPAPPSEGGVDE